MKKEELESKIIEMEKGLKELKKEVKLFKNVPLLKLADYSWEEIVGIFSNRTGTFEIGDSKLLQLETGEVVTAKLIGFKHDDKSDGSGKAPVTFYIEDLEAEYRWNATNTNEGGWRDCRMRNKTMQILFNSLPECLKNSIVEVNKKTTLGNESKKIDITKDKLFVLSVSEYGMGKKYAKDYASSEEGEQYEYFKNNDINKDRSWTSFRSRCHATGTSFCCWNSSGCVASPPALRIGSPSAFAYNHK